MQSDAAALLRSIPAYSDLTSQKLTMHLAVVSEEQNRIAWEAYLAYCEKRGLTPDDTDAICKAISITLCYKLSQSFGRDELSGKETTSDIVWQ